MQKEPGACQHSGAARPSKKAKKTFGVLRLFFPVQHGTCKSDRWHEMRNNQGQDKHVVGKVEDIATVLSIAIEGGQNSCPGISKTPQNAPLLQGHTLSEHTKKSMTNKPLSIGTVGQQYLNMDLARPLIPVWPSKMYLSSSCSDNKSGPSPLTCLRKTKMRPVQLVHCSGHSQCLADASVDGEAALQVCSMIDWNQILHIGSSIASV
ncbi:hypothetical protein BD769DRAFT_1390086 [Suillus cothurnatus]|nr:hypothetical protein BD769DRAFT_1390086 [Suillus cothurnatus]